MDEVIFHFVFHYDLNIFFCFIEYSRVAVIQMESMTKHNIFLQFN